MKTFTVLALAILLVGLLLQSDGCNLDAGRPTIYFNDGSPAVECKEVTALGAWVFCDTGDKTEDGIPFKFAYLAARVDHIDGKVRAIEP